MLEKNLLLKILDGCKEQLPGSQQALYNHYYGYAMSICLRYSRHEDEAAEILNDSFLKVFNKIGLINEPGAFKSWLRRILINSSIDYHRKQKKYSSTNYDIENIEEPADDIDTSIELSQEEILLEIQKLPPSLNVVFNLYVFEGLKHREIGKQLGISESTSRANLTLANKKLRQQLKSKLTAAALAIMLTNDHELHSFIKKSLENFEPSYNGAHWEALQTKLSAPSTAPNVQFANGPELASVSNVTGNIENAITFIKTNAYFIAAAISATTISVLYIIGPFDKNASLDPKPSIQNEKNLELENNTTLISDSTSYYEESKNDSIKSLKPLSIDSTIVKKVYLPQKQMQIAKKEHQNLTEESDTNPNKKVVEEQTPSIEKQESLGRVDARPIIGFDSLYQYFEKSMKYPDELRKDSIVGKVFVAFRINRKGEVNSIEIEQGLHELLDQEAMRVMGEMPLWYPTTINGIPINSSFTLPITFNIDEDIVIE